jgi:hypothetical protein
MVPLIFRDTVNPQLMTIDGSFDGVIAYANGRYAWPPAQISRYVGAGKHLYRYDVDGSGPNLASVLDVERYDATPAMAAKWVPERNALHNDAGCYTSFDAVPELVDALGHENAWLIVADWTGHPFVPALKLPPNIKFAGVQYADMGAYDLLAVYSAGWLGRHT